MTEIRYLLDTNIFIAASRGYYHFDICPDFWTMLIEQNQNGRVLSIKPVKEEILPKTRKSKKDDVQEDDAPKYDRLALWVKNKAPKSFFADCNDLLVAESYREIIQSVQANRQYLDRAKDEFATVADSWVIAYARAHALTVVTHENNSKDAKKRVLIPAVCEEFDVPIATLFEMLIDLKIKFVRK